VNSQLGWEIEGALCAGQLPPSEVISTTLINDILQARRAESQFLLILDDFHVILITRKDPSLPLARLQANNQLTAIRAGDLHFTYQETGRFLEEVIGLSLSQADSVHPRPSRPIQFHRQPERQPPIHSGLLHRTSPQSAAGTDPAFSTPDLHPGQIEQ
jgi:ATP/maltotriose-dependent transcriptional regulator MalT